MQFTLCILCVVCMLTKWLLVMINQYDLLTWWLDVCIVFALHCWWFELIFLGFFHSSFVNKESWQSDFNNSKFPITAFAWHCSKDARRKMNWFCNSVSFPFFLHIKTFLCLCNVFEGIVWCVSILVKSELKIEFLIFLCWFLH